MKRPLKPSDVPPGSAVCLKTATSRNSWTLVVSVDDNGIFVERQSGQITWHELERDYIILRPGEDWQECAVDEFNPADYKPGQEVDFPTARKLHEAGVKLEYTNRFRGGTWELNATAHVHGDDYLESSESKFRIALPPKMRDLRLDELPEFFKVVWPDNGWAVWKREGTCPADIRRLVVHKAAWTTDLNATELNSFQVEDE